jgi:hypothetical protein
VKVLSDAQGRWNESPEVRDLRLVDTQTGMSLCSIAECISAAEAGVDDVWQYL